MDISGILNIPILQAAGLLILWGLAERMGLPISKVASSLLNINQKDINQKEVKRDEDGTPDWANKLISHYNEETTDALRGIELGMKEFRGTQLQQCIKLDSINDALQDMSRNGIRIRN